MTAHKSSTRLSTWQCWIKVQPALAPTSWPNTVSLTDFKVAWEPCIFTTAVTTTRYKWSFWRRAHVTGGYAAPVTFVLSQAVIDAEWLNSVVIAWALKRPSEYLKVILVCSFWEIQPLSGRPSFVHKRTLEIFSSGGGFLSQLRLSC